MECYQFIDADIEVKNKEQREDVIYMQSYKEEMKTHGKAH